MFWCPFGCLFSSTQRRIKIDESQNAFLPYSETGRIRFRRARFQTLNSVSFFIGPHRVPGRELSEFLSAYYLCAKANSLSFSQNSPSLPQNSARLSEFPSRKQCSRNSIPPVSQKERLSPSLQKRPSHSASELQQMFQKVTDSGLSVWTSR